MNSIENMDSRLARVDMHNYMLSKIGIALKEKRWIEASWLIYACFENRYMRVLQKIKPYCEYGKGKTKCGENDYALGISTRLRCVKRLVEQNVPCFHDAFRIKTIDETFTWLDDRNKLMHRLLTLESYENMDIDFQKLAERGFDLLQRTYEECTVFRREFFTDGYVFEFPEDAMKKCQCRPKKKEKEDTRTFSNVKN